MQEHLAFQNFPRVDIPRSPLKGNEEGKKTEVRRE
jgi:hypothetical protein